MFRRKHNKDNDIFVHKCVLPQKEAIIVDYIDAGWCIGFRRKFRVWMTVSDTNQRSLMFLRSNAAIRQEKARHLQHYYYIIHPFSDFRAYWEYAMTLISLASLFIIPIQIMTVRPSVSLHSRTITWVELGADLCCLVDCSVTFGTGYFNPNTKQIILDTRQIVRNYLTGYFVVDVISSFPFYMFLNTMNLISLLKILRIFTVFKYVQSIKEWKGYSNFKFKVFKMVLIFLLIIFWMGSIKYALAIQNDEKWVEDESDMFLRVLYCLYIASFYLLQVGHRVSVDTPTAELYIDIVGLSLGVILKLYILVQVMQVLQKYQCSKNKYRQQLHQQLNEYVQIKELSPRMKGRLFNYFEYKYQEHYYKESEIMASTSLQLKQEIILAMCRRFVEQVEFFRELPPALIVNIVTCLKSVVYLPNNVICQSGIPGDAMYFISSGTVAVYTENGIEVCHLTDGAYFGEVSLVLEEKRMASVVAVQPCEIFRLRKADFQRAMNKYPEYLERVRTNAKERVTRTRDFAKLKDSEETWKVNL